MLSSASVLPSKFPGRVVRPVSRLPVAQAATVAGAWRYQAPAKSRPVFFLAVLLAGGAHAFGLLAFNRPPAPARIVAAAREEIIQVEMPPLTPDEPETPPEEIAEPIENASMPVPQLAEIPTAVPLNALTQTVDFRPAVEIDQAGLKTMTIPVSIGRGNGGTGAPDLFNLADLDRKPEAIAQPAPQYPFALRGQSLQARVVVQFIVDSAGRVSDVRVEESTHNGFDQAAVDGVARWKFKPGQKGGRKVATRMIVPIRFEITE